MRCLHQIPKPRVQETLWTRRWKEFKSQKVWRTPRKPGHLTLAQLMHIDTQRCTYIHTETVVVNIWLARVSTRWGPRVERKNRRMPTSLNQKLSPVDNHLEMKNLVSSKRVSLLIKVGWIPRSPWTIENKLYVLSLHVPCLIRLGQGFFFLFFFFKFYLRI